MDFQWLAEPGQSWLELGLSWGWLELSWLELCWAHQTSSLETRRNKRTGQQESRTAGEQESWRA